MRMALQESVKLAIWEMTNAQTQTLVTGRLVNAPK